MSTFSYSTIGIGNRDVTQITTTIGLASRLEIGEWAHVESPDDSDVIIVDAKKSEPVAERYGKTHLLVALADKGSTTSPISLVLERPAGYSALINLFRSLETRVMAQRTHNRETTANPSTANQQVPKKKPPVATPKPAAKTEHSDHPKPPPPVQSALSPPTVETPVPESMLPGERPTETPAASLNTKKSSQPDDSMADIEIADIQELLADAPATANGSLTSDDTAEKVVSQNIRAATETTTSSRKSTPPPTEKATPVVNLTLIRGGRHAPTAVEPPSLDNVVRPARRFYPASRLLGMIHSVIAKGTSAEISHPDFPPLSIFPVSEWFQFDCELGECPALFRVSSTELFFREISSQKKPKSTQEWLPRPLWALSYTAAYFGSEGRLMQHCSPWDQLQLLQEPDFSLLPHEDEHPALATYLLEHQADIETIAKDTGIELPSIINFTNACQEAHLLHRIPQEEKESPSKRPQSEKPHRYRVFSWFRKPFSKS
ncbi:MAG TPA: hypothetical protein ENJ35_08845 [Gammaproteobacteria bacterium]|nr:hypothetical protein [Gammaproteobacteria bacterium]